MSLRAIIQPTTVGKMNSSFVSTNDEYVLQLKAIQAERSMYCAPGTVLGAGDTPAAE